MNSIYVIKPKDNTCLTQVSPNPLLKSIKIRHIEVNPSNRSWKIFCFGKSQEDTKQWQKVARELVECIPSVTKIDFIWEDGESQIDEEVQYMESLVKNAKIPSPIPQGRSTPKKNNRRAFGRGSPFQEIKDLPVSIESIEEEAYNVTIQGQVVTFEKRITRTGKLLITFDVYDSTDTITCKLFSDSQDEAINLDIDEWVKVKGNVQFQFYDQELSLMVQQICPASPILGVADNAPIKRVEFHLHTKMSGLDGLIDIERAVKQAADWGHPAIAITDHGVVQAFPAAFYAGEKYGVKIIYGLEGYLIDNETDKPYHIIILAKNKTGLKNLYKLVSYSHLDHFYRQPRIPRKILNQHREGLILGTACEQGELYQAILRNKPQIYQIAAYYDYLEIQPLGNNQFLIDSNQVQSIEDLKVINQTIVKIGEELNIPVVATGDVHFLRPEDSLYRTILLSGQGFEDAERQAPLYFRTTDEMLSEFSYLGEKTAEKVVIKAPNKIAAEIQCLTPIPHGLHAPKIPHAEEKLEELCYKTAHKTYGKPLPALVAERLQRELKAVIGNGYAALYWTAHQLVEKSMQDGYLVGSRGSVGSSLAAYFSGITEVNPLSPHYFCSCCHYNEFFPDSDIGSGLDLPQKNCPKCGTLLNKDGFDIPFEVFLGFHGDKVPDIDLNFSGEYQDRIQQFTEELFGSDHVFRAGTVGTLADKTAFGFVKNYLEDTNQQKRKAEINRMLKKLIGVKRTTGQHPGGMIVVPKDMDIYDFTPVQYPANDSKSGVITTHFEFSYIHDSLVKLDNLGHKGPTMLKMFEELSGKAIEHIPLDDVQTMEIFKGLEPLGVTESQIGTSVGTLGLPEFGTEFIRQMLEDIRPTTFADLVAIMGLSHGTDVWLNNAQVLIKKGITDFKNVIACRDDIMIYLIHRGLPAADAFRIMEQVRRGRGLSEADVRLMKEHGIPDWYIDSCFKIKYMFPKAHAAAYALTAYRAAYFKVHHPVVFYATFLSLEIEDVNADLIIQEPKKIRQYIADIKSKGNDATAKENDVSNILEIVLEAMSRGIEFLPVDLYNSDPRRVIPVEGKLLLPLSSLDGVGLNAARNIAEARIEGEFLSVENLRQRSKVTKTVIEALQNHNCLQGMPETNQLSLFSDF